MGDLLVRHFMIFGVPGQNWMLIALAIILVGLSVRGGHENRPNPLIDNPGSYPNVICYKRGYLAPVDVSAHNERTSGAY